MGSDADEARYRSDAEREAQIEATRQWLAQASGSSKVKPVPDNPFEIERWAPVMQALDEARAEIAQLGKVSRCVYSFRHVELAESVFDEVIALLFDGEKPKLYLREEAEAPILHAIVQARAEIVRQHEEIAGYIAAYTIEREREAAEARGRAAGIEAAAQRFEQMLASLGSNDNLRITKVIATIRALALREEPDAV